MNRTLVILLESSRPRQSPVHLLCYDLTIHTYWRILSEFPCWKNLFPDWKLLRPKSMDVQFIGQSEGARYSIFAWTHSQREYNGEHRSFAYVDMCDTALSCRLYLGCIHVIVWDSIMNSRYPSRKKTATVQGLEKTSRKRIRTRCWQMYKKHNWDGC